MLMKQMIKGNLKMNNGASELYVDTQRVAEVKGKSSDNNNFKQKRVFIFKYFSTNANTTFEQTLTDLKEQTKDLDIDVILIDESVEYIEYLTA